MVNIVKEIGDVQMKRKMGQIIIAVFIMGATVTFYSICWLDDAFSMTDEQYAREAQRIVNCSLPSCQHPKEAAE